MLRVAVIGAGSIGREFALKHLRKELGVEVVAVVDTSLALAEALAYDVSLQRAGAKVIGTKYRETVDHEFAKQIPTGSLHNVRAVTDLSHVINEIDMCYIGTPPSTHAAIAVSALSAHKHVLLEKPIAVTDADADAIVSAATTAWAANKTVVNVNIGMRFSAACLEMKRLIENGSIGELQSMKLRLLFPQWPREWQVQPWVNGRRQGGPLLEVGTHWIFGLLEIVGHDSVKSVVCTTAYPDGPEGELCESECRGYIELNSGVKVDVEVVSCSEEAKQRGKDIYELHATGTEGRSIVLYDFYKLRDGVSGSDIVVGGYGRQECVIELVRAVKEGSIDTANLVTPTQARNVQRIISQMKCII